MDAMDLQQRALAIIEILDDLPEHGKSLKFWQTFKQLCPADLYRMIVPLNKEGIHLLR